MHITKYLGQCVAVGGGKGGGKGVIWLKSVHKVLLESFEFSVDLICLIKTVLLKMGCEISV